MKIALVISSLGPGGAERVLSILANAWAARGTPVTLITLSDSSTDFYRIDPRIERVALRATGSSSNALTGAIRNIRRIRTLRTALRAAKPDAVVSFMTKTNVLALLACRPLQVPCIVAERTSPPNPEVRGLWSLGVRYAYSRAHAIAVQTQRGADWFRSRFPSVPVRVIPNPVVLERSPEGEEDLSTKLWPTADGPFIVAMGRLTREKGFDLLLRAFAQIGLSRPSWSLVIVGDGPERNSLEQQAKLLGLGRRVHLVGLIKSPQALLRRASAFVLSSRFEGMPMALLEAMACGLPCVSFDCPTGPRELIRSGVDGLLVPPADVPLLAQAIGTLLDSPALRRRLSDEAVRVADRYCLDHILAQWESALEESACPP